MSPPYPPTLVTIDLHVCTGFGLQRDGIGAIEAGGRPPPLPHPHTGPGPTGAVDPGGGPRQSDGGGSLLHRRRARRHPGRLLWLRRRPH
eukprot:6303955-Pyramimonas_sp.AAC.2